MENELLSKSTLEINLLPDEHLLEEHYESDSSTWSEESDCSINSNETDTSIDSLSFPQLHHETPLTNEETEAYVFSEYEAFDPTEFIRANIHNELAFRDYFVHAENPEFRVHHFNWMGYPVYQHSSTPPEESLAFILADPKFSRPSDEYRIQAIMGCAASFVDPVIVRLDDMGEEVFRFRGSKLAQAANGRVLKYYTPHGQWMKDPREENGDTTLDEGNFNDYVVPGLAVGSGFVDTSPIRSRAQWKQRQEECLARSRMLSSKKLQGWRPRPSPLRASMSVAGVDTEEATAKASSTTFDDILKSLGQSVEAREGPVTIKKTTQNAQTLHFSPKTTNARNAENLQPTTKKTDALNSQILQPTSKKTDVQNAQNIQSTSKPSQAKSTKRRRRSLFSSTKRRSAHAPAAPVASPEEPPFDASRDPTTYFSFPIPGSEKPKKKFKSLKPSSSKKFSPKYLFKRALSAMFDSGFAFLALGHFQP